MTSGAERHGTGEAADPRSGGPGTRWLVISYFANIDALATSHHIDDRLSLLRKEGIEPILLSSPCGARNRSLRHMRVPSLAPSGIRYETRYFLRRKGLSRFWFKFWETVLLLPVIPFYALEKILIRLDSTTSWALTSSLAALWLCRRHRPSLIYSTGGPFSGHLAAAFASRRTGIPYVVEFQDPLEHQYTTASRLEQALARRVERRLLGSARLAIFLTRIAAERGGLRHPGAHVQYLYPGAPPPAGPATARGPRDTLSFAHFGSLAGNRDLACFLPALENVLRERPSLVGRTRLGIYGGTGRNVQDQIAKFGFPEVLTCPGKVPREQALAAMAETDVLLLIQNRHPVSEETIPSKFFEYLHAGSLILGVIYRNPELRSLLEERGHLAAEADSVEDIGRAIRECVGRWESGRWGRTAGKSPYTAEAAVRRLVDAARSALDGKTKVP